MTRMHWLAAGLGLAALSAAVTAQDDPKALFTARYAELRDAMQARDDRAIQAILTADFQSTDIRGESIDAKAMIERLKEVPVNPNRKSSTTVLDAKITGKNALVHQKYEVSMPRKAADGVEHSMTMVALSDDNWVQSGSTWLLQRTVTKDLTVFKDGEEAFHQAN